MAMTNSAVRTDVRDDVSEAETRDAELGSATSPPTTAWWLHFLGVLWTVVLAGLTLAPALARGWMLGTYDLLATKGLTVRPGVVVHGNYQNTDLIGEIMQWTKLNWVQVHHGFLPLWNPYNGVGLPLAFNWQASSFGVPSLIGYLLPVRYAYTASVAATLIIAGTGAYVLARTLRLGFLGSVMVATVFELGGPLMGWLGYPHAQVLAWAGWLFAAGVLIVRGNHRVPAIALFAVVLACAIYAGQPEVLILVLAAAALFVIVLLALRAMPAHMEFGSGPIRRPVIDLVMAGLAGLGLGAPLLLPGFQLSNASVRAAHEPPAALPAHDLTYLIFSSFDGVPVPGNFGFDSSFYYGEFAAYVGVIAAVLAAVAVVIGVRRRRPEVIAAAAVAVVMGALAFVGPLDRIVYKLPLIGQISLLRALMPLSLALAVLAGVGLDAVVRKPRSRFVPVALLSGFGAVALVLAGLWLFGRGGGYGGLPAEQFVALAHHARNESFVWPVVCVAVGLAGTALLWWRSGLRLVVAGGLLLCETLFLLPAGSIQIASSANGYPPTPAVSQLQRSVGSAVVGTGTSTGCQIGIPPEANIEFGVHEVDLYDPIVPKTYFTYWQRAVGTSAGDPFFNMFCPGITTAVAARGLGVGYVLVDAGTPGPAGGVFVKELAVPPLPRGVAKVLGSTPPSEDLYRIPGSSRATVIPVRAHGPLPPPGAPGTPVTVHDGNPAKWSLVTHTSTPALLRLHLADVPGWHATIDGHPLTLQSLSGLMFEARVPPGRHVIELHYWPTAFTVGLFIAVITFLVLAVALGAQLLRRTRKGTARSTT
jgi:hypothetical protein